MRKFIVFIMLFIMTGCSNQTDYENTVADLEEEISELTSKIETYEEKISEYESTQKELEKETEKEAETEPEAVNELQVNPDSEFMLVSKDNNELKYIYVPDDGSYQDLTIVGSNRDNIMEYADVNRVQLGDDEGGLLAITVVGSIYNVKLQEFEFNDSFTEKTNIVTLDEIEEVHNSIIEVYSDFPEGVPNEMITWENPIGVEHSYTISYDGYGFGGFIILDDEM